MKRNLEHAWTTATLIATAALAIALAIAAIVFTRATATGAVPPPQTHWVAPLAIPAAPSARMPKP